MLEDSPGDAPVTISLRRVARLAEICRDNADAGSHGLASTGGSSMALYVLVGPDGRVCERWVSTNKEYCWPGYGAPAGFPRRNEMPDVRAARRLGWRVRKCKIVLDEDGK